MLRPDVGAGDVVLRPFCSLDHDPPLPPLTNKLDYVSDSVLAVVAQPPVVTVQLLHRGEVLTTHAHDDHGHGQGRGGHKGLAGLGQVWQGEREDKVLFRGSFQSTIGSVLQRWKKKKI